ncbi:hypothetical protein [Phaeobacter inhibens]|nr:hypothetical protein [Phaeobacter inhibens]
MNATTLGREMGKILFQHLSPAWLVPGKKSRQIGGQSGRGKHEE